MNDILVTGLGAVSCHGVGVPALWSAMSSAAARPPQRLTDPDAHLRRPLIHRAPVESGADGGRRACALALIAAQEAVAHAGLHDLGATGGRTAVVLGSCLGETRQYELRRDGVEAPAGFTAAFPLAAVVGERLGAFGPNHSVSNACAASGFAITIGADLIRTGAADVALVGGADAYSRVGWACFDRLGAVDPVRCRPFDRHREGTVLGEGAAVLVLESVRHARQRGAGGHATLAGSGWSCDAHHQTAPEPSGQQIVRAMRGALDASGTAADALGCVVPHGTGTRLNDEVESRALRQALGAPADRIPLYSLKALLGHTGGAAAALAAVAGALILRAGQVPRNVPLDEQDAACDVFLPQDAPVPLAHRRVLVNAYGFGGNNVSFVLGGAA